LNAILVCGTLKSTWMTNWRFARIFAGENMLRRLFDKQKSPRNLPRKSTASEPAAQKTRIAPVESENSSNGALRKDACVSAEAFRLMAARMENGTKKEARPWPGHSGLLYKRLNAFRRRPFSSASSHSKGFGDVGGRIRLGLGRFISPIRPLVRHFDGSCYDLFAWFAFADFRFSVSDFPKWKGVFDHGK
jgi:hypothetical protein